MQGFMGWVRLTSIADRVTYAIQSWDLRGKRDAPIERAFKRDQIEYGDIHALMRRCHSRPPLSMALPGWERAVRPLRRRSQLAKDPKANGNTVLMRSLCML